MIPDVAERTAELSEFCKLYHVARLDIFGKAVTADSLTDTDSLTFLVEFQFVSLDDYFDTYFGLLESLEQLFGQPVELVIDSAIKNSYFRQIVEETRVNVYAP